MKIHEFRRAVARKYPHVTIKMQSVGFSDLARCSRKCLTVNGEKSGVELFDINQMASEVTETKIIPDTNVRFYK